MLKLEKVKAYQDAQKSKNPESYIDSLPAFTIGPKKEKGSNSMVFNREAIELMKLFTIEDEKALNKLLFVNSYQISEKDFVPIFHTTSEESVTLDKKYSTNAVSRVGFVLISKSVYDELVRIFVLDSSLSHTFILEQVGEESEKAFRISLHKNFEFNEGEDVEFNAHEQEPVEEEETGKEEIEE